MQETKKTPIAIVDDKRLLRNSLQEQLQYNQPIEVLFTAENGIDFLQQMEKRPKNSHPLVVLMDIEMPEMDGYTFTAAVRENPKLKDLHIILHTSLSGVFNEAMVKKVGADDFLSKFNPDLLAQRLNDRIFELTGEPLIEQPKEE